jgi:hypothetical protein
MVSVAPVITGIIFGFTFHMRCTSIVRYLYFLIFQAYFCITFLSPELQHLLTCFFFITMSYDARFLLLLLVVVVLVVVLVVVVVVVVVVK